MTVLDRLIGIFKPPKQRPGKRKMVIRHQGEHYDLKAIYDQVNAQYFEGKLDLRISWVGNKHSKPRTQVMFGSFNQKTQLIKIHRRLDQSHVPPHFIAFIVYHEMLHHVLPPIQMRRRRRNVHHPAFLEREKQFAEYDMAKAFSEAMKKTWFRSFPK